MPYCPRCHSEYKEIYRLCPVCKIEMLNEKPTTQERATLTNSEIQVILNELNLKLSSMPISKKNFYISPIDISEVINYDSNIVYDLQKVANDMCDYLGLILKPRLIYIEEELDKYDKQERVFTCDQNGSIHTIERERNYAGLYNSDYYNRSVTIVNKRGYTQVNLIGVLAHEITHHFLSIFNISKPNEAENEIFTDIAACYLGFGHFIHPAYKNITYTTDWSEKYNNQYEYIRHKRMLGYITPETLLKAIKITCEMKNWDPKDLLEHFIWSSDKSMISMELLRCKRKIVKNNTSTSISKIISKWNDSKIQKVILELETIQKKYDHIKKVMMDTSRFKGKHISKEDAEFLVNLSNDIFTLSIDDEIKLNIKKVNNSQEDTNVIKKNIFVNTKKLHKKIDLLLARLDKITK